MPLRGVRLWPVQSLDSPMTDSTTAVLSIDVQQSFPARPYWREDDVPAFRKNVTRLIDGAAQRGWPVVRILHEDGDGPFAANSGLVKPLDWMPPTHAVSVVTDASAMSSGVRERSGMRMTTSRGETPADRYNLNVYPLTSRAFASRTMYKDRR